VLLQAVTFGAVMVVAVVLLLVERRIGRKPESERSPAEARFMSADRSAARSMNATRDIVSPFIASAAGLGLLVFGVVWLTTGQERAGWVGIVLGSLFVAVGILLLRMRTRRSP
jgi:Flp pilus assembly protein TadB